MPGPAPGRCRTAKSHRRASFTRLGFCLGSCAMARSTAVPTRAGMCWCESGGLAGQGWVTRQRAALLQQHPWCRSAAPFGAFAACCAGAVKSKNLTFLRATSSSLSSVLSKTLFPPLNETRHKSSASLLPSLHENLSCTCASFGLDHGVSVKNTAGIRYLSASSSVNAV